MKKRVFGRGADIFTNTHSLFPFFFLTCCCKKSVVLKIKVHFKFQTTQTVVCYGWDCLWYVIQWKCHQTLCAFCTNTKKGKRYPFLPNVLKTLIPWRCLKTPMWTQYISMGVVYLVVEKTPQALRWNEPFKRRTPIPYPPHKHCWIIVGTYGT